MKKSILTLSFAFCILFASAQMPHFSREKPHKPKPAPKTQKVLKHVIELWIRKDI